MNGIGLGGTDTVVRFKLGADDTVADGVTPPDTEGHLMEPGSAEDLLAGVKETEGPALGAKFA